MSSFLDLIGSPPPRPRRVLLYGTHGIGKSTFAACAPKPVFICTEDGLRDIQGAKAFPLCNSITDVFQQVEELRTLPHNFETLAIDSADWAEQFVQRKVCETANKNAITEVGGGFGRGEDQAASMFKLLLAELSRLNIERNMMVILLAHCRVEKIEPPGVPGYSRYSPKLDKRINDIIQEWADEVLFANYKVYVSKEDTGFGRERGIGMGSGERVMFATEKPGHLAKNRLTNCPEQMPFAFANYWELLQKHFQQSAE